MAPKEEKIIGTWEREELAAYLENLAIRLRSGTLTLQGDAWSVPERLAVKMRTREKKGRIETKMSWHWSTLEEYAPEVKRQIDDWHSSIKQVKKRMGTAFKEVVAMVEQGQLPAGSPLDDLVATSRLFAALPEAEWQEAMDEYMDHLATFVRGVEEGNLEAVRHEVRDLQYRMRACHREFK